jgi:hypothetical protein
MATTTTNYGFDVPTSSDLVKNGATQIALLGQDLDTFLFRPFSRNAVINGGFDIWQRGTSTTSTSAGYTCADRFATWISSGTGTIERVTANIPDTFSYGIKYTSSGAGGRGRLYHTIETLDAQKLAGQTVTLSFYVSGTVGKTFIVALLQSATVDNSFTGSYTSIGSQTVTLTATSTRYEATYTIPTTAKTIQIQLANVSTDLFANTENYTLTGVQLEVGNQVTPFIRAGGGTIQGELSACQRYYYRVTQPAGSYVFCSGLAYSSTQSYLSMQFPVTMRVRPTALEQSGTAADYRQILANATAANCTTVPTYDANTNANVGMFTTVASGLVAGNFTYLSATVLNAYLGWSAEL